MVRVKVCGVRSLNDALACVEAGVDTIGLNFWEGTPRRCDIDVARTIGRVVAGRAELVAVFVDATFDEIRRVQNETGIEWVQLHGSEPPELLEDLLPSAYKALRVAGVEAIGEARRYAGDRILLDASVPGQPGGTGRTFDWSVAARVATERATILAGGLVPENVGAAIAAVSPWQVDVASGVESAPGMKDAARVRAFVAAVRDASGG